jgi:hypothetical protein
MAFSVRSRIRDTSRFHPFGGLRFTRFSECRRERDRTMECGGSTPSRMCGNDAARRVAPCSSFSNI